MRARSRSATSATRSGPSSRSATRGCAASCFTSCSRSTRRTAAWSRARASNGPRRPRARQITCACRCVRTRRTRCRRSCFRRSAPRSIGARCRFRACTWRSRSARSRCSRAAPDPGRACCDSSARCATTGNRRASGPVEFLDALGVLDAHTLVVHGVQLQAAALERLAAIGCTLVTCPRSNQWVGAGAPPIERFFGSGVRVAVGTDSLASVADLNLFSELKAMRWLAPGVSAAAHPRERDAVGRHGIGAGRRARHDRKRKAC